jgi:TetR/AcrR family transcriptional regulator, fatty acid metabolism regulator protein
MHRVLEASRKMETMKPTGRKLQADKTRQKIYDTAIALMEKKGYAATTIVEIMGIVGVSVGTFYHYFKSKEDIFFELFKKADEYFEVTVRRSLDEPGLAALGRIVQYFKYYARYNGKRGLENISQLYNTRNKLFTVKGRYMQELLKRVIKEGQEFGEIAASSSPAEITEFLFIAARGLVYDWCLHQGKYDLEKRMEAFMGRLIDLFKPA